MFKMTSLTKGKQTARPASDHLYLVLLSQIPLFNMTNRQGKYNAALCQREMSAGSYFNMM